MEKHHRRYQPLQKKVIPATGSLTWLPLFIVCSTESIQNFSTSGRAEITPGILARVVFI